MSHPTIVRVYDAGEDCETDADGTLPPVPYIDGAGAGRLLKDIIDDGPVPIPDAVRYTDGILEALEYSHRACVTATSSRATSWSPPPAR
jgi:serine/threonine-protein kinase